MTLKKHRSLAQHTHTGKISTALRSVTDTSTHEWLSDREDKQISASIQSLSLPILAYFYICMIPQSICFQLGI